MSGTLGIIQALVASGNYVLSQHAYDRLIENGIDTQALEDGVSAATQIEDYPDFHKGPSVLVLQFDAAGQPIHVVWGLRKTTMSPAVVVTVYRPDPQRWTADFRSRI